MDVVGGEAEAHEDALEAEYFLEACDDGDGAAAAGRHGPTAVGVLHGALGGLVGFEFERGYVGGAAVAGGDLDGDVVGCHALEVFLEHLGDLLEVLVGDEAGAYLGVGLGGEDGFGALAGVAAPDAADVEAGAYAGALLGGEASLAVECADAKFLLVASLVEGGLGHEGALLVGEDEDVVVEAGDGDVAVRVVEVGDHLAEHVDGVGHGAAEEAGVEVVVGAGDFDLPVAEAAEAAGDAGHVGGNHRGVGDEDDVGLEQLFVFLAEAVERAGADFLFALEHELDVAGEVAGANHVFEGLGVHEGLAFVVVGAAGPDAAVDDDRLEGLCAPELKRSDGHDVVVAIDEDGGFGGVDDFLAIDDGVAVGGHDLGAVGAGLEEQLAPALGAAHHVALVLLLGADGGDADEGEELVEETVAVLFDVLLHII